MFAFFQKSTFSECCLPLRVTIVCEDGTVSATRLTLELPQPELRSRSRRYSREARARVLYSNVGTRHVIKFHRTPTVHPNRRVGRQVDGPKTLQGFRTRAIARGAFDATQETRVIFLEEFSPKSSERRWTANALLRGCRADQDSARGETWPPEISSVPFLV